MKDHIKKLHEDLHELQLELRHATYEQFNRMNPFSEDLSNWKEKGAFWTKDKSTNVTIYDSTTLLGDVKIGNNTWIGPYCNLDGSAGLVIGEYCSISSGAQLLTHDTAKWALSKGRLPYEMKRLIIGDCCFIGTHAIITKGLTIGNNCLIAAGTVVTKDVESFSIVAGVPGRVIGKVHLNDNGEVFYDYY
jgi:acetyltransferase-like isoleucine patch superfamily enzyme